MDVHLRDLRYFVAVAEELSFTRAATRLHVSQPALSKQIRQLERTLRATLLLRDSQGVTLSDSGSALLPQARQILSMWDGAEQAVARAEARHRRLLTIGLQTSIGRDIYPAVWRRFAKSQPGWRLALRMSPWTDPSAGLRDKSADAAFMWLPVPADVEHRVLFEEPRWVALPSGHRLAENEEVDFSDLLGEPFVALPQEAGAMRDYWLALPDRSGVPPVIGVETATPDETFEAIASGLGVHLLAEGNAAIYARTGITCRPVRGLSPCALAVAWRPDEVRPQVQSFVRACLAVCGSGRIRTA